MSVRAPVAALLVALLAPACNAEKERPPADERALAAGRLAALKQAAVYVMTGRATGSGVLIRVADYGAVVATNEHVVRGGSRPTVVFRAGERGETRVEGRVVLEDADRDLALVLVPPEGAPRPLSPEPLEDLTETQPVYVVGYPFGDQLATGGRAPSVTVVRATISALRRDEAGKVVAVQLDGGIDPGNSGGPVATADGRLVGISVAKLLGTSIGFAIPAPELRAILERWDADRLAAAPPAPAPPAPQAPPPPSNIAPLAQGDSVLHLGGTVVDAALAGDGRVLLLRLGGRPGLVTYDLEARRPKLSIPVPAKEFLFAAGGDVVLAYLPETRELRAWRISTATDIGAWKDPMGRPVTNVCMGHARGDRAVIRSCEGSAPGSRCTLKVIDPTAKGAQLASLAMHDFPVLERRVHLRATPDLATVAAWGDVPPSGVAVYRVGAPGLSRRFFLKDAAGVLVPGRDGRVYSGSGTVYAVDGKAAVSDAGLALVPAAIGAEVLGVGTDGLLSVRSAPDLALVRIAGRFPGASDDAWTAEGGLRSPSPTDFTFDKQVVLDATRGRITLVTRDGAIVERTVPSGPAPSAAGSAPAAPAPPASDAPTRLAATVVRGDLFTWGVDVRGATPPLTFKLARAPRGMVVTSEGVLAWNVPAGAISGSREPVVVEVVDAQGACLSRELELTIR